MRVSEFLFQFGFFFLYLLWSLWLGLPKLCWIEVSRVGIRVLFFILEKCFQFFTIECDASCGFVIYAFIVLRLVPSMRIFWRLFIINDGWILSKAFSASIKMIISFLFFNLLMWCITLIVLWIPKNSLHPWKKSHLIMVYDIFNVPLNLICYCFAEKFCVYVH